MRKQDPFPSSFTASSTDCYLLGPLQLNQPLPDGLTFLSDDTLPTLFQFPKDMDQVPAEVNRPNNQVLVQYYEDEWRRWN
ncbi:MAG: hypothetical protein IT380_29610 [Myxococcales bacterium]|nr:hypothetical protein [Myxococcales bacterium]